MLTIDMNNAIVSLFIILCSLGAKVCTSRALLPNKLNLEKYSTLKQRTKQNAA